MSYVNGELNDHGPSLLAVWNIVVATFWSVGLVTAKY